MQLNRKLFFGIKISELFTFETLSFFSPIATTEILQIWQLNERKREISNGSVEIYSLSNLIN